MFENNPEKGVVDLAAYRKNLKRERQSIKTPSMTLKSFRWCMNYPPLKPSACRRGFPRSAI